MVCGASAAELMFCWFAVQMTLIGCDGQETKTPRIHVVVDAVFVSVQEEEAAVEVQVNMTME